MIQDGGISLGWNKVEDPDGTRLARFLRSQTDIFDLTEEGRQYGSLIGGFEVCRKIHLIKLAQKYGLPLDGNLPLKDHSGRNRPCMSAYMTQWWHEGRFGAAADADAETDSAKIRRLERQIAALVSQNETLSEQKTWAQVLGEAKRRGIDIKGKKRPEIEAELDA